MATVTWYELEQNMPCWPLKVGQALHRGVEVALSSFVVKLYLSCIEMDSNISLTEPRIACFEVSGVSKL